MSDHEATSAPEQRNGWRWEDPRWREWTGNDPAKLLLEVLRRGVEIRDRSAEQINLSARPVMLVDVLNALCNSLQVSGSELWDGSDLWSAPRCGEGYDEAASWERSACMELRMVGCLGHDWAPACPRKMSQAELAASVHPSVLIVLEGWHPLLA